MPPEDLATLYLLMRTADVVLVIAVLTLMAARLPDWRAASQQLQLLGLALALLMLVSGYSSAEAALLQRPAVGIRTPLTLTAHVWCAIAILYPLLRRRDRPRRKSS